MIARVALFFCALLVPGSETATQTRAARPARCEDLVALFQDWPAFQRPGVVSGVPDYTTAATTAAMTAQQRALPSYQRRLASQPTGSGSGTVARLSQPGRG